MKCIGLDVHKRVVQAAVLHDTGEVEEDIRFTCTPELLRAFCRKHVGAKDKVALEATTNCWAVAAIIREFTDGVIVSNPMRTKLIAQSRRKTDKVDALILAQLLSAGFLPGVWEPDAKTREKREITSRRAALVHDRTAVKNRLHAVLAQRMIVPDEKLFSKAGHQLLRTVELDVVGRQLVDSDLRQLAQVEKEIAALDDVIARLAQDDDLAKLLMTLPGFDFGGAVGVVAGAGDMRRFPDGNHFASYFGLVPSTKQSAETTYHGPITKAGRAHVRWIFCQAAMHLGGNKGPLGHFFRRLAQKKGHNKAVVATARKLAVIAWHLLVKKEPYRYAEPRIVEKKLSHLRIRTTKTKRKTSLRGTSRPATYGSGVGTRIVKDIDTVLAAEALPPRTPAPAGEKKFLQDTGLDAVVAEYAKTRRLPRIRSQRLALKGKESEPVSDESS
jgi:transposase